MRKTIFIICLTSLLVVVGWTHKNNTNQYYSVIKVVDGDTIKVNSNGSTATVRLIGIDTPEVNSKYSSLEKFGNESSVAARSILIGKTVRLVPDEQLDDKDKYGRLLRYVYLEDGTMFNEYMISEGYATEFTYLKDYKLSNNFKKAQEEARSRKKGLWK